MRIAVLASINFVQLSLMFIISVRDIILNTISAHLA